MVQSPISELCPGAVLYECCHTGAAEGERLLRQEALAAEVARGAAAAARLRGYGDVNGV